MCGPVRIRIASADDEDPQVGARLMDPLEFRSELLARPACGVREDHRLAVWLGPQLVVQEVVFQERELQTIRCPAKERDDLLVWEQVPVLPDNRDVDAP